MRFVSSDDCGVDDVEGKTLSGVLSWWVGGLSGEFVVIDILGMDTKHAIKLIYETDGPGWTWADPIQLVDSSRRIKFALTRKKTLAHT